MAATVPCSTAALSLLGSSAFWQMIATMDLMLKQGQMIANNGLYAEPRANDSNNGLNAEPRANDSNNGLNAEPWCIPTCTSKHLILP